MADSKVESSAGCLVACSGVLRAGVTEHLMAVSMVDPMAEQKVDSSVRWMVEHLAEPMVVTTAVKMAVLSADSTADKMAKRMVDSRVALKEINLVEMRAAPRE